MSTPSIEDYLRRAYAFERECPLPESYLRESLDAMTPEQRKLIEEHASNCPACAAEFELAAAWDASPTQNKEHRDDVDAIVASLCAKSGAGSTAAPTDPERRFPSRQSWWLAAAAVLVVGLAGGFFALRPLAPTPLPERVGETVMRGAVLEIDDPVGDIGSTPESLRWTPVAGAATYTVRLTRVDGSVVLEETVRESHVDLPPATAQRIQKAVMYEWRVEARDERNSVLARSQTARFRIEAGIDQDD